MKVEELIKELKKHDKETEVHVSIDSEGNAIKTIHNLIILQDGDFVKTTNEDYTDIINGEKLKWQNGKKFLTIYPTDDIVAN